MEQHLDPTYLRPDLLSRCLALGVVAVSVGLAILFAGWGFSSLRGSTNDTKNPPCVSTLTKVLAATAAETTKVLGANTSFASAIQQEVVVFWSVRHGSGSIVTGWKFPNGNSSAPTDQYCYFNVPNADHSSTKIDISRNGIFIGRELLGQVPDIGEAQKKCRWWRS